MNEWMRYIAVLAMFKLLGRQKSIRKVKNAVDEATRDYDKHNPPHRVQLKLHRRGNRRAQVATRLAVVPPASL